MRRAATARCLACGGKAWLVGPDGWPTVCTSCTSPIKPARFLRQLQRKVTAYERKGG